MNNKFSLFFCIFKLLRKRIDKEILKSIAEHKRHVVFTHVNYSKYDTTYKNRSKG